MKWKQNKYKDKKAVRDRHSELLYFQDFLCGKKTNEDSWRLLKKPLCERQKPISFIEYFAFRPCVTPQRKPTIYILSSPIWITLCQMVSLILNTFFFTKVLLSMSFGVFWAHDHDGID